MELRIASAPNMCLDVASSGTSNGTPVHIWSCNGTGAQMWFFDHEGRLRPWVAPNKCLDVHSYNRNNGAQLVIWDCHGDVNQKWY
jgi:hypothetical protein